MTSPVDDAGNPQVDFVWGNMPLQPDDQRPDDGSSQLSPGNSAGNRGWDELRVFPSDALGSSYTQYLSVGDQSVDVFWMEPSTRNVSVPADNHVVAADAYNGFPGLDYSYPHGDLIPDATVPDVVEQTISDATNIIEGAGLVVGDVNDNIVDATTENDGYVLSQDPAAGTLVNTGDAVNVVKYHYLPQVPDVVGEPWPQAETDLTNAGYNPVVAGSSTVGATETNANSVKSTSPAAGTHLAAGSTVGYITFDFEGYPIAGIRYDATIDGNSGGYFVFINGRTNVPDVSSTIYINGSGQDVDGAHDVLATANDDSFNTGGTKITVALGASTYDGAQIVNTGVWSRTNIW